MKCSKKNLNASRPSEHSTSISYSNNCSTFLVSNLACLWSAELLFRENDFPLFTFALENFFDSLS